MKNKLNLNKLEKRVRQLEADSITDGKLLIDLKNDYFNRLAQQGLEYVMRLGREEVKATLGEWVVVDEPSDFNWSALRLVSLIVLFVLLYSFEFALNLTGSSVAIVWGLTGTTLKGLLDLWVIAELMLKLRG